MSVVIVPTGTFGAVVTGVDVADLDHGSWSAIEAAFDEHGLLVFPGQGVSDAEQAEFGARFGSVLLAARGIGNVAVDGESVTDASDPSAVVVTDLAAPAMDYVRGNLAWHLDGSFSPADQRASLLSARVVPPIGGDTEFCDLAQAYDALSRDLQASLLDHTALHCYYRGDVVELDDAERTAWIDAALASGPAPTGPTRRPMVRRHPRTGRSVLCIGRHIVRVDGVDDSDVATFVDRLLAIACQPPRVYSHRWKVGDLLVWDNARALHRVLPWDFTEARVLVHTRVASTRGST